MEKFICDNLTVSGNHLLFAGIDTVSLAEKYGTPLYLMDEERVRSNCRQFADAFRNHFSGGSYPLYAGKANAFREMYRIVREEGFGIDVVSAGEIHTAVLAGFPMEKAFFHGNNKTDEDIRFAMEKHVGTFVIDNTEELHAVQACAKALHIRQKVLIRVTPGIDPHTYAAVNTGTIECKFGFALETGQAEQAAVDALSLPNIELMGFHCHIGSQVFQENIFERACLIMLDFIQLIADKHGFTAKQLDIGGGFGTRYTEADGHINIGEKIHQIAEVFHSECAKRNLQEPDFFMEPGRSIVADAGLTLYKVGSVKTIPKYKTYVAIDGGMTDNPRFALYGSQYTCLAAGKMQEPTNMTCTLAGHCCESGDILCEDISLPDSLCRGDYLAVCTTGAYNYSMASNYNRFPRPAVVMLNGGTDRIAVRRETLEDITRLDTE